MTGRTGHLLSRRGAATSLALALFLSLSAALSPEAAQGQSDIPGDRIHLSVALGGYFLMGVGYTHWVEEHHALEFTVFPFVQPGEGFPFGLRVGHAWIPSDEVWRAKLGEAVTVLVDPTRPGWDRLTPIIAFAPGIQYAPDTDLCFRGDLWMSYFPTQGVFAPTTVEFLMGWKR